MLYGYCLELSAEGLPFAPFTGVPRLIGNQRVLNDVMIVITFVPTSWTGHTRCGRRWPNSTGSAGSPGWTCPG